MSTRPIQSTQISKEVSIKYLTSQDLARNLFRLYTLTMDDFNEETQFVADEVSAIVKDTIENIIGGQTYSNTKVTQWTSSCVEGCLMGLTSLQKPFKYIVNCTIMQKSGAGLHTASSCFWDNATDGCCTVRWENKTLYCIVSVFGLAI